MPATPAADFTVFCAAVWPVDIAVLVWLCSLWIFKAGCHPAYPHRPVLAEVLYHLRPFIHLYLLKRAKTTKSWTSWLAAMREMFTEFVFGALWSSRGFTDSSTRRCSAYDLSRRRFLCVGPWCLLHFSSRGEYVFFCSC